MKPIADWFQQLSELQSEIQKAVETNPLLELDSKHVPMDLTTGSSSQHITRISEPRPYDWQISQPESLSEHLLAQLPTKLDPREQLIALTIIDSLDTDGYLRCDLSDIVTTLQNNHVDTDLPKVLLILAMIQACDPAGIGARNLQECLLIQLDRLQHNAKHLAGKIIEKHFVLIAEKKYSLLKSTLNVEGAALQEALHLIQTLNPRPASYFQDISETYVTPDVLIRKENKQWDVRLSPHLKYSVPKINTDYTNLMTKKNDETSKYLRHQMQEAKWLINSIETRNITLLKVAHAIIDQQTPFLERGELAMKPLRLSDIARIAEVHESTVSRITTQKYIHTPHGIFELKHFFSSQVTTTHGGHASSTAIRALIRKLINEESDSNPLSDSTIADLLKQHGINVARRTITKYREALNIPSSGKRKFNIR